MTKRQHVGSNWIAKIRRGGTALAAIGMLGTLAMAASGCDTVARINFDERSFDNIHVAGFAPAQSSPGNPGACEGVGSDGEMRARFVLTDNDGNPIQLGETVNNQSVELNHESVQLSNSALMEVSKEEDACAECSSNFACGMAPGLQEDPDLRACVNADSSFSVASDSDAVDFIADTSQDQVFGLLVEQSGSLTGWNPPASGSGLRVGSEIATDSDNRRWGAVIKTTSPWEVARELAADNGGRDTYYGLWSFNEQRLDPTSYVEQVGAGDTHWTNDGGTVEQAVNTYASSNDRNSRANVYESIENLIEAQYTSEAMQSLGVAQADSVDKQLVVFVDGYDDMRDADNATINSVVEAATDNNVRIFIVHLDPKLGTPSALQEDPAYPDGQEPCSDDSECKNFETCAQPQPSSYSGEYDSDESYCLPERDAFGRTGPIDDYAQLACATGGGYMYVPSAEGIDDNLSWTPLALDGLWEAKVTSGEIRRGNAPAGAPLRLHTDMSVNVAGRNLTYHFSQFGDVSSPAEAGSDEFDTRGVVFTADE